MKNNKFLAGMFTGIAITMTLVIFFIGIREAVNFVSSKGLNVVPSEYENPYEKFDTVLEALNEYYYEDFDTEAMYDSAIEGFVDGVGDRYTVYYNADDYKDYYEDINGTYEGIGSYVGYGENEGELIIIAPMDGSPSLEAGIKAFDRILAVDEVDVNGMTTTELVKLIKGPEGTDVVLKISRNGEIMDITITRAKIVVPTVSHNMLEEQIGIIRITGFDGPTYDQFMEAYVDLQSQSMEGLIIDLRFNGGGYTHIVSAIADELLPEGLIYYTEDKNGERKEVLSDDETVFNKPIVVLVNGSSASASEILAGAIKDHERGVIVGEQTFGKGLVQSGVELDDGSFVSMTIARYFTPDGHFIHGEGITPDIIVEVPPFEEGVEYPEDYDPQLDAAKEEMLNMLGGE